MGGDPLVPFDARKPSVARGYDYALGGKTTPDLAEDVIKAYRAAPVHLHSREQVAGYFAGLEIIEPGLTEARHWRPDQPQPADTPRPADILAGVGRKTRS